MRGMDGRPAVIFFLAIGLFVIGCAGPPRSSAPAPARWTNSIGMEFALIPAGTFTMGGGPPGSDEAAHVVTVTKSFYLSRVCVTKGLFKKFREATGIDHLALGLDPKLNDRKWESALRADGSDDYSPYIHAPGDEYALTRVSWTMATAFSEWLSKREGMAYRLATEAEWDIAKRAGSTTQPWFGIHPGHQGNYGYLANYEDESPFFINWIESAFPANPLGIFPVGHEWVRDRDAAYPSTPQIDPEGPTGLLASNAYRIIRLGHGTGRMRMQPDNMTGSFRVVCEVDERFSPPLPVVRTAPPERQARVLPKHVLNLSTGVTMDLLEVPAGTFAMGRPLPEYGPGTREWPQTQVTIPRPFRLGRCEVTQAQFRAVTGLSPSHFKDDDRPVECVTWDEIAAFFAEVNRRERTAGHLPDDEEYRLPTEAEWEYACRAGTDTLYHFGDDPADLPFYEVVDVLDGTHPVGSKRSNQWGFYDMGGNVLELTNDLFGPYPGKPVTDPFKRDRKYGNILVGWLAGRGGSWCMGPYASRTTLRRGIQAHSRCPFIGFRVARGQRVPAPEMKMR